MPHFSSLGRLAEELARGIVVAVDAVAQVRIRAAALRDCWPRAGPAPWCPSRWRCASGPESGVITRSARSSSAGSCFSVSLPTRSSAGALHRREDRVGGVAFQLRCGHRTARRASRATRRGRRRRHSGRRASCAARGWSRARPAASACRRRATARAPIRAPPSGTGRFQTTSVLPQAQRLAEAADRVEHVDAGAVGDALVDEQAVQVLRARRGRSRCGASAGTKADSRLARAATCICSSASKPAPGAARDAARACRPGRLPCRRRGTRRPAALRAACARPCRSPR